MDDLFTPFVPQLLTDSQKLDKILLELTLLKQELDTMVITLAQLDAAIAAENTAITSLDQGLNALVTQTAQLVTDVAALAAKLTAGMDYTNELNAVQAGAALTSQSATSLSTGAASVTAADTDATGA
jgi:chromosome segregation ATPase